MIKKLVLVMAIITAIIFLSALGVIYFLNPLTDQADKKIPGSLRIKSDTERKARIIFKNNFESSNLKQWTGKRCKIDGQNAMGLVALPENKYFGVGASYNPEKKILKYSNNLMVSFKYYAKSGSFIYISFLNETKNDNYHYYLRGIKTGKWIEAKIPLNYFSDNEFKGKPLTPGDVITKLNFFSGAPGEKIKVYIDDIKIYQSSEKSFAPSSPDITSNLKEFTEDFESPDAKTRWFGSIDSALPGNRSGTGILALPAQDKYFDVAVKLNSWEPIFIVGKDSIVEFEYYIDQPVNLYVSLFNQSKNDNFHFEIHMAEPKLWKKVKVPLKRLVDNSFKGVPIEPGDKVNNVNVFAGRPGSTVSLWVDNIKLSTLSAEPSTQTASQQPCRINNLPDRKLAKYEYITRSITMNMRKHYKNTNRPKSIMNLGDSISKSMAFFAPMRYNQPGMLINEGYEYINKDTAAADCKTSAWGREIIDKVLKIQHPETVTILFGTNDISSGVYTGEYFANMEYIVQTCLDNGSIPILLTIPPLAGTPADKIEKYNYQLRTIAMEKQIPLCDIYKLFLAQPDWNSLLFDGVHPNFFEDGSKIGGYNLINNVLFEMYKILERDVMPRPEEGPLEFMVDTIDLPSTNHSEILYYFDFEDGNQGWIGEPVSDLGYNNSNGSLELVEGNNELCVENNIQFKVTPSTYIALTCYSKNCPRMRVQLFNKTQEDNFWAAREDLPDEKWVKLFFDLNKDFTDNEFNNKQIYFNDLITGFRVFGLPLSEESKLIVDNIEIFNASDKSFLETLTKEFQQIKRIVNVRLESATLNHPLIDKIKNLSAEIDKQLPRSSADGLCELKDKIDTLSKLSEKLDFLNQTEAVLGIKSPSIGVGYASAMVRISPYHKHYPFKGKVTSKINILAAQHEYENFQLYLVPLIDGIKGVDIKFNNLTHTNGKDIFSASNFKWFLEGYVTTKSSFPVAKYRLGRKPDPLLPGEKFDLDKEELAWITVYVPQGQVPGDYNGTMSVVYGQNEKVELKITLKVWNFQLPLAGRLYAPTTLDLFMIQEYYKTNLTPEKRRDWYKFCLDYRIDPTSLYHYGLSPKAEDLDFCEKLGLRTIIMGGNHDQPQIQNQSEIISSYNILKEKNLLYKSMIFITDKFGDNPEYYNRIKEKTNWVRQNCPGLKIFAGISPREPIYGYVDIWDPIIDDMQWGGYDVYIPSVCKERQEKGEKIMWYVAASPWYPYPNVMMDNDLIESRVLLWMTWKHNIDGFEYYYFNLWGKNLLGRDGTKKWPQVEWDTYSFIATNCYNGDGQLVYPGPNMTPYSCIRLENIRDGIEDYEMLNLLKMYVDKTRQIAGTNPQVARLIAKTEKILDVPESITKNLYIFTRDPETIEKIRKDVGNLLEIYKKALQNPSAGK